MGCVIFPHLSGEGCQLLSASPPPAPDGSGLRRTSTASSAWPCSPPDLNRELPLAVFPDGPQPPAHKHIITNITTSTTTNPNTQSQTQTQSQTHSHEHNHKHTNKHNHNTHNRKDTSTAHNHSTQPQHTTTTHNHSTQPEDPQAKSRTTKLTTTTMATCSSPWREDK